MSAVTGAKPLLRATLRHDGRMIAPWVLILTLLSASSIIVYPLAFPTVQDRMGLAAAIGGNPALAIVFGPAFDISSTEGFNSWRSLAIGGFLTALGVIFAVTRATRKQEDSGQAELLASGVMGRSTRLLVGVLIGLIASLAIGVVSGLVAVACGGEWGATMLLSATFTVTGWMFTGVAAVTSQIGSEARMSNSLAVGLLGVLHLLRGFFYAVEAPQWAIDINPLGWMTETKPAFEDTWFPLIPGLALTVVLLVVAFVLQSRRDFGAGIIPPRPGPARGAITTPLKLVWRINRPTFIAWSVAFIALGLIYGYLTISIQDILSSNAAVQQVLAAGATTHDELVAAFTVSILNLVGIIAAIPGVQTMIKFRSEELEDRVEPILAAAISRQRYYGANIFVALLGPALYMIIAGVIIAALAGSADIGVDFSDTVLQALVTIPAVWLVVGVSVAVIGARPHVSIVAWAGVILSFGLTLLGPTFNLWEWVLAISPFWHVPHITGDSGWWGLGLVGLIACGFMAVGVVGFRRRDLAT